MTRFFLVLALLGLVVSRAQASEPDALSGIYNTGASDTQSANGETLDIEFHPCADAPDRYCGTVVALHEPNGPGTGDPLPSGDPVVGFQMIENLKPVGDGKFMRGRINAMDESFEKGEMIWYGLRIEDEGNGTLIARGCVGFLCPRKMVWTKVAD